MKLLPSLVLLAAVLGSACSERYVVGEDFHLLVGADAGGVPRDGGSAPHQDAGSVDQDGGSAPQDGGVDTCLSDEDCGCAERCAYLQSALGNTCMSRIVQPCTVDADCGGLGPNYTCSEVPRHHATCTFKECRGKVNSACDHGCAQGLLCCYPCGVPGCTDVCTAPADGGGCPQRI